MVRLVCQGFTSFRANQRLWLYLYLTKLGLALIVTIPVLIAAQSTLDNTLYSTPLLKEWSLKVIGELIAQRPFVLGNSLVAVMVFGFLALVIRQFLNGGVYLGYSKIQRISRREFFGASGEKFGTHLRITGVMAIFYLLFGGIGMWLGSITGVIVGQLMPKAGLLTVAVPVGVLGLVLIPAVAFSDMLRAVSVKSEGAPIRRLLVDAFTFYRLHWVKLVGTYVMLFCLFVVIWLIVERLALVATGGLQNKVGVVVELLLFQGCSFMRTGQSLLFTASVVYNYHESHRVTPEPRSVEVNVD